MSDGIEWAKLFVDLPRHPKLLELEEILERDAGGDGCGPLCWHRACLGLVVELYLYCAEFARDGVIKLNDRAFARILHYDDEPKVLVESLVQAGFLEPAGDGEKRVHGFADRNAAVRTSAERTRKWRARHGGVTECHGDVTVTVQNQSQSQKENKRREESESDARAGIHDGIEVGTEGRTADGTGSPAPSQAGPGGPAADVADEVVRQLLQAAEAARCPSASDTMRRHVVALLARGITASRIMLYLRSPEAQGRTVNDWQDHFRGPECVPPGATHYHQAPPPPPPRDDAAQEAAIAKLASPRDQARARRLLGKLVEVAAPAEESEEDRRRRMVAAVAAVAAPAGGSEAGAA